MPDPFTSGSEGTLPAAENPFRPGIGRVPPAFGGRDRALHTAKVILDVLASGGDPDFLLIRGVRGIGKTALMAYVRRHATASGIVCCHIEADRGVIDPEAIIRRLLDAAEEMDGPSLVERIARRVSGLTVGPAGVTVDLAGPSGPDATAPVERVVELLGSAAAHHGRGVLLTVDEVQEAEDTLFRPLIRAVHLAAQDAQPVGLIAAGLPGAADALREEGQTYTERLDTVELGMLDRAGVSEALAVPFEARGIEVDDGVLDVVAEASGGYPFFVQVWGWALWLTASRPDRIDLQGIPAAREVVSVRVDQFMEGRTHRIPGGRAHDVVAALARLGGDASTAALLRATGLTGSQYSPVRQALLDAGLVHAPRRGRIAFTVPGFAGWIDRNGTGAGWPSGSSTRAATEEEDADRRGP